MSRNELYATALRNYLQKHQSEGITQRLDEIYGTDDGVLDPAIARLQARSLPKDAW
jgi:hypothetical protein